ncbi:MAG TPA: AI-2E family transporter [Xanthobacteraceae bacterium]|nr:AI-2E family transporter [Xanthobacteraceae bacterium]
MYGERLPPPRLSKVEFFERAVIVVLVALTPVLIWFLFDVILVVIGAIVIATLLRLIAGPFATWGRLPQPIALTISGVIIVAAVGGTGYLFGTRIEAELSDVFERATAAAAGITTQLQSSDLGKVVLSHIQGGAGFSIPGLLTRLFSVSITFIGAFVVTIIGGFYLAAQPGLYRDGLAQLFPPAWRGNVDETVDDIGRALQLWLIGVLFQMAAIGVLSTLAVWLIGLPSPLALGVIAGLAEFIPYLGPLIAAVPAILVAVTKGGDATFWTLLAYLAIHQIEGNLIVPLIQRRMVYIPPAVMLLGVITILFLFGGISVIFAGPIAVMVFVAIKKLYVRDSLGEPTPLPGEP